MAGIAPSTRKVYSTGGRRYEDFCTLSKLKPYPTSEKILALFVGHLYMEGLAPGTIKSYLAAVRYDQVARGLGNPNIGGMPQLGYIVRGLKRLTPVRTRKRLPITPGVLRCLKAVWKKESNRRNAKMLWAAACLCFFGFLRSGEAVAPSERSYDPKHHLCFEDICIDDPKFPAWIQVIIKASKTDPFRQGVTLHLGRTGADLCPVVAVLEYMVARGSKAGPLFMWQDGRYLTRTSFVKAVRAALTVAGFKAADFAGHSFRIGAATTASTCGIQDSLIKTLGRWESSAYTCYIRTPPEVLRGVSRSLIS